MRARGPAKATDQAKADVDALKAQRDRGVHRAFVAGRIAMWVPRQFIVRVGWGVQVRFANSRMRWTRRECAAVVT
jgi:hypothetical protein